MPEGGRLTIRTSDLSTGDGDLVLVEVSDTGKGIPPELRERIFEPYFTTKKAGKGTGLGLAAVYGSVLEHGGRIDVRSAEGRGTVFAIELPVTDALPAAPAASPGAPAGELTVLVIDDEEMVRGVLRAMLEGAGYHVLEAADGAKGLALFRERSADIDLVILDVAMPVMGGEECFAAIRDHDPGARVVIATGFAQATGNQADAFPGRAGLLHKPFRNDKLQAVVRRAVSPETPA
jgi:CheY-like chemotaxis protein